MRGARLGELGIVRILLTLFSLPFHGFLNKRAGILFGIRVKEMMRARRVPWSTSLLTQVDLNRALITVVFDWFHNADQSFNFV